MSRVIWVRSGGVSTPFETNPEGELNIPRLAKELHLDPDTVKVDGVLVDWNAQTGYTTSLGSKAALGATQDAAVNVMGQAAAGTSTGVPFVAQCAAAAPSTSAPGTSHLWFTDGKSSVAAPFRQGQVQLAALEELYPWWPPKAYIVNGYWVGEGATPGWGDLDLEAVGALGRTQQQPIPVKRASGFRRSVCLSMTKWTGLLGFLVTIFTTLAPFVMKGYNTGDNAEEKASNTTGT